MSLTLDVRQRLLSQLSKVTGKIASFLVKIERQTDAAYTYTTGKIASFVVKIARG